MHQQQVQALLAQFSAANSQLAIENDKLRSGRLELARDHSEVLNEIDYLRSRLSILEGAAVQMEKRSSGVTAIRPGISSAVADVQRWVALKIFCFNPGYLRGHIMHAFKFPNMCVRRFVATNSEPIRMCRVGCEPAVQGSQQASQSDAKKTAPGSQLTSITLPDT